MLNILKGILIAISTIVPGVSGGTMMIILGVYDKSIEALSALVSLKFIHRKMVIQLAVGVILGLLLFSNAMLWLIGEFPYIMAFLFLGIVVFGLGAIVKRVRWDQFRSYHILFLIGGLFVGLVMTNGQSSALFEFSGSPTKKLLMILIAGIIIAVALILPGISTSFLLLALGLYEDTLLAIKSLDFGFIIPLGIGVLAGALLTTRILEYCMKEHPTPTYLMIIGFILGSIGEIYPGWPASTGARFTSVLAFIAGTLVMYFIQVLMRKYPDYED
ncbi:MAG: DUF368 domain-containing protein [Clostridiales bacterium]|nr:DUF368 domain-containing protein [Clostridiales bacterium]